MWFVFDFIVACQTNKLVNELWAFVYNIERGLRP